MTGDYLHDTKMNTDKQEPIATASSIPTEIDKIIIRGTIAFSALFGIACKEFIVKTRVKFKDPVISIVVNTHFGIY